MKIVINKGGRTFCPVNIGGYFNNKGGRFNNEVMLRLNNMDCTLYDFIKAGYEYYYATIVDNEIYINSLSEVELEDIINSNKEGLSILY